MTCIAAIQHQISDVVFRLSGERTAYGFLGGYAWGITSYLSGYYMKKHDLPAMPFYFGDWRKCPEVQAMEPDVRMMWFDMLGYMWESTERGYLTLGGKAIPEVSLARLLGMDITRLTDGLTTMDNLSVFSRRESDGAIYCRRMVKEEARREQNRINGSKGGNPNLSDKGGVEKSVNRKPNHLPEDESEDEIDSSKGFDAFWSAYPKKVGKGAARKAWAKQKRPGELLEKVLAALSWQVKSEQWTKDSGQYIPNPATYLNEGRGDDEPQPTRRPHPNIFANGNYNP